MPISLGCAGDSPIQVFFTAGHAAMLGGVGGTGEVLWAVKRAEKLWCSKLRFGATL